MPRLREFLRCDTGEHALSKLTDLQRRYVWLYAEDGLTQRQIATRERVSQVAVLRVLNRALATLQGHADPEPGTARSLSLDALRDDGQFDDSEAVSLV